MRQNDSSFDKNKLLLKKTQTRVTERERVMDIWTDEREEKVSAAFCLAGFLVVGYRDGTVKLLYLEWLRARRT